MMGILYVSENEWPVAAQIKVEESHEHKVVEVSQ